MATNTYGEIKETIITGDAIASIVATEPVIETTNAQVTQTNNKVNSYSSSSVEFSMIEECDDHEETCKIGFSFIGREAAVIIATGNPMSPLDVEVINEENLYFAMCDFTHIPKQILSQTTVDVEIVEEGKSTCFYIDTNKAGTLVDGKFIIDDEEQLASLLTELTSLLTW